MTPEEKLIAKLQAIPSFERVAPWWEILLAKLFGRKAVHRAEGIKTTLYHWRGITYVIDLEYENVRHKAY